MRDICEKCNGDLDMHEFGVPAPYCPSSTQIITALRAELAQVKDERDALKDNQKAASLKVAKDMAEVACKLCDKAMQENSTLTQQLLAAQLYGKQLREALEKYGRHDSACVMSDPFDPSTECTCGLETALNATPPDLSVIEGMMKDAGRLDFVLEHWAFVLSSTSDAGVQLYQLMEMDEDENMIAIS
jgi:hypothetical protein